MVASRTQRSTGHDNGAAESRRLTPHAAPQTVPQQRGQRRWAPRWLVLTVVFVLVGAVAAGTGAYLAGRRPAATTAQLMQLSGLPHRRAPGFTLTDQHGRLRSLASFEPKPVALYFMDPKCTDVCPLVAQEFAEADRDLGPTAHRVALVGVDVNPGATAEHWVRSFDAEHGLDKLANWHFFTGPLATLEAVWRAYALSVQVTSTGNVLHTTLIDFIGRHGFERSMVVPQADERANGTGYLPPGQISQWGHGIAGQLRGLLAPERQARR